MVGRAVATLYTVTCQPVGHWVTEPRDMTIRTWFGPVQPVGREFAFELVTALPKPNTVAGSPRTKNVVSNKAANTSGRLFFGKTCSSVFHDFSPLTSVTASEFGSGKGRL